MIMAKLIAKQLQLQRLIERALDNFKKIGKAKLTPAKIRSRVTSLKESWSLMLDGHAAVCKAVPEDTRSSINYFQQDILEVTEDVYQSTLDHMMELLEELESPASPSSSAVQLKRTDLIEWNIMAHESMSGQHVMMDTDDNIILRVSSSVSPSAPLPPLSLPLSPPAPLPPPLPPAPLPVSSSAQSSPPPPPLPPSSLPLSPPPPPAPLPVSSTPLPPSSTHLSPVLQFSMPLSPPSPPQLSSSMDRCQPPSLSRPAPSQASKMDRRRK